MPHSPPPPKNPQIGGYFQNVSVPTIFELEIWGLFHFVQNLVAYKVTGSFFSKFVLENLYTRFQFFFLKK